MSNNLKVLDIKRTFKLALCALSVLIAFGFLFYRLQFGFGILDIVLWLFIYSAIAIAVSDVVRVIEAGKQTPWVLGMLCMPIFTVPLYVVLYGKRNAL